MPTEAKNSQIPRPPVIAVMGHIDHGKSTLLDYIRKSNITGGEAGGITQHIAAYEVSHTTADGEERKITFLDTPGHEAFIGLRSRGAKIADIAILVVSAEDGVKPQTLEALKCITDSKIPFAVAINKIDKPNASIERTKQSLAEHNIFIEEWGGSVPTVPISAKAGTGIQDLLDTIILMADMEGLTGNPEAPFKGVIIETKVDQKTGLSASLIIKDGSINQGDFIAGGGSFAPVRTMYDFLDNQINFATFSSPIRICGWDNLPQTGAMCTTFNSKKDAEDHAASSKKEVHFRRVCFATDGSNDVIVSLIVEADTAGSAEGIIHEIDKIELPERTKLSIIKIGVGAISEGDIKSAVTQGNTIVCGFNAKVDSQAKALAERNDIEIRTFSIIYELTDYIKETLQTYKPEIEEEKTHGEAVIKMIFKTGKGGTVAGGLVKTGSIKTGDKVVVVRNQEEVGFAHIEELQSQKIKTSEVSEGSEFGGLFTSKGDLKERDIIRAVHTETR